MRAWQIVLVVGFSLVIGLFYKGLWGDPTAIPTVLINTPAPVFSGPEVDSGEIISLSQYQGKVVMLNFWASWCYECKVEHENLLAIQDQFGTHPEFVLLGVNFQDQTKKAQQYLRTYGSNFQHVRDLKGHISIDYGVYGVPETFVLDRQGMIRFKHIGPLVGPTYTHIVKNIIEPLLQDQAVSTL